MPGADVVVPSWNGRALLEQCLPTLLGQPGAAHIVVVDNGSTDGTAAMLAQRFPDAEVVALRENRGFATAVNAGIAAGSAEVVVLVNNDVECDAGFVAALVAALAREPGAGMAAGLLLARGRATVDSYGVEVDRTLAAFPRFARAPWPVALHDRGLALPSGGAAAYRRAALEVVGGFDEGLFAYMEDVDLGLRLAAAGWGCAGAPGASGVHLGSATFGRRSRWQVEVSGFARAYMLRKYGVLRRGPATAAWALAAEAGVVALDATAARDLAAARGRVGGWRAARGRHAPVPEGAINRAIGPREALRRRRAAVPRVPRGGQTP
jgi:N-acetylglucosaminyl-diphospho-decaprenol L-rhamnosyltransferase